MNSVTSQVTVLFHSKVPYPDFFPGATLYALHQVTSGIGKHSIEQRVHLQASTVSYQT